MKKTFAQKNNILLVNITRLGDMLQATPTIAGMKMENPHCRITVLVEKQFEDICHYIPNIDEVVSIDLGMTVRCLAREQDGIIDAYEYVSEVVEQLRAKNFDYCLNMSSSAYTALLLKLVGIERNGGWTSDEEGYRIISSDWAKLFATSVFHQNRQFNSLNLVDVFRCSADVEQHPRKLLMTISEKDLAYADELIANAGFTNQGPLIALQAGASQEKRQWAPRRFIELARILSEKHNARLILTGSNKEREIIDPIVQGVGSKNVVSIAGKTSIPQLGGVLTRAKLLITGDTGPMHMAVAVGTPVVSMFLASAYGYETGPYSEGNIVIQPVITCGPCNPNKPCARPDCHDTIEPSAVAQLAVLRLQGEVRSLPSDLAKTKGAIIYRSEFDEFGFLDLRPISFGVVDPYRDYRVAYRRVWLEELGGFNPSTASPARRALSLASEPIQGLNGVIRFAEEGKALIDELIRLVRDPTASGSALGEVNKRLSDLDREIEQQGFFYAPLAPVTRMFMFAKENLSGTEALELASQMRRVYDDLAIRAQKLGRYYSEIADGGSQRIQSGSEYGLSPN